MKTFRELLKDVRFSFGGSVMFLLVVLALLSFFSPYGPVDWYVVPSNMPPSWEYFLGTNSMGQDVFWQLTFALRNSVVVALLAAAISRAIAVTMGLIAGYHGGIVERVLMSISDGFMVLPIFMILVLLSLLAREYMTMFNLGLMFGVVGWAWDTRLIRSQILSLREREFTYTAVLSATPARKLIFNEYIPFIIPLALATLLNNMVWVIGMEITLTVIGVTNLAVPTLGTMLRWAITRHAMLLGYWWWLSAPIGAATALLASLYLLSVSVSVYLDPRARSQRVGAR